MENKKVCQICKKREAYKKLVSNLDGSFILVCKKKKCIEKVYEDLQPSTAAKSIKEFISMTRWDRDEHQGRTYRQVTGSYEILNTIGSIVLVGLLALVIYSMF